jgi:hypothetical protein
LGELLEKKAGEEDIFEESAEMCERNADAEVKVTLWSRGRAEQQHFHFSANPIGHWAEPSSPAAGNSPWEVDRR